MSLADELYRETILDHYHHPRNHGIIAEPTVTAEGVNPLCGDEVTLYMKVQGGEITDIKLESRGCSINTASGSMMTEAVLGQPLEKTEHFISIFKNLMLNKSEDVMLPDELEDLEALEGVKKYPVRIKCALLPWNTLLDALQNIQSADSNGNQPEGG